MTRVRMPWHLCLSGLRSVFMINMSITPINLFYVNMHMHTSYHISTSQVKNFQLCAMIIDRHFSWLVGIFRYISEKQKSASISKDHLVRRYPAGTSTGVPQGTTAWYAVVLFAIHNACVLVLFACPAGARHLGLHASPNWICKISDSRVFSPPDDPPLLSTFYSPLYSAGLTAMALN